MELRARVVAAGLLLAGAGACGEGATPPPVPISPTALRLDLETPHSDDGAVVLSLRGPDISNLQAASSAYLAYSRSDSGAREVRLIIVGDLKGGALATVSVGPGHQLSDYSVTIDQVAARNDTLRVDLSGYRVSVTVP
jgi:hypothetical protein